MTAPAPPASPEHTHDPARPVSTGPVSTGPVTTGPVTTAPGGAHSWRIPAAIALLVLLGAITIVLLAPGTPPSGYLDPGNTGPTGTHALADLLSDRGTSVVRTTAPAAAQAAVGQAGSVAADTTVIVTSPDSLTGRQLTSLALIRANLMLVAPDLTALSALTPGVTPAGTGTVRLLQPGCSLPAASLAGSADLGGVRLFSTSHTAARCYLVGGLPTLLQYQSAGRAITILGTARPLTNGSLARAGNAALMLNLLRTQARVVWLLPAAGTPAAAGPKSLTSLIPLPAYLIAIQLAIAVLLAALWRGRRLGPLVAEPLPVTIRAAETVEGHARLYQARRARGRAASELRTAMIRRVAPMLGLPPSATPAAVVAAVTSRSRRPAAEIETLLFGPPPRDDAALAAMAAELDALEKEVRTQ